MVFLHFEGLALVLHSGREGNALALVSLSLFGTKQDPAENVLRLHSYAAFPERDSDNGRLNILLPRLLFCLINLAGLAFGLWKVNGMGLLPTHASDYSSAMSVPRAEHISHGGTSL